MSWMRKCAFNCVLICIYFKLRVTRREGLEKKERRRERGIEGKRENLPSTDSLPHMGEGSRYSGYFLLRSQTNVLGNWVSNRGAGALSLWFRILNVCCKCQFKFTMTPASQLLFKKYTSIKKSHICCICFYSFSSISC